MKKKLYKADKDKAAKQDRLAAKCRCRQNSIERLIADLVDL